MLVCCDDVCDGVFFSLSLFEGNMLGWMMMMTTCLHFVSVYTRYCIHTDWYIHTHTNIQTQVASTSAHLLVTLDRTAGDPVLFVKPVNGGHQPGALPSVRDFPTYAAAVHYTERVNQHWVQLNNLTDTRYVLCVRGWCGGVVWGGVVECVVGYVY